MSSALTSQENQYFLAELDFEDIRDSPSSSSSSEDSFVYPAIEPFPVLPLVETAPLLVDPLPTMEDLEPITIEKLFPMEVFPSTLYQCYQVPPMLSTRTVATQTGQPVCDPQPSNLVETPTFDSSAPTTLQQIVPEPVQTTHVVELDTYIRKLQRNDRFYPSTVPLLKEVKSYLHVFANHLMANRMRNGDTRTISGIKDILRITLSGMRLIEKKVGCKTTKSVRKIPKNHLRSLCYVSQNKNSRFYACISMYLKALE